MWFSLGKDSELEREMRMECEQFKREEMNRELKHEIHIPEYVPQHPLYNPRREV